MSTFRESVEVAVPAKVAYERLCHFEDYPQFMSGVKEVTCLSDSTAHWVMDLGGRQTEFDTQISRRPDELLAWQAIDGPALAEKVTFQQLSTDTCRITAELDVDTAQLMPKDAHAQETINRRFRADLDGLKQYLEQGRTATATMPTPSVLARGTAASARARQGAGAPYSSNQGPHGPHGGNQGAHFNAGPGMSYSAFPDPSTGADD